MTRRRRKIPEGDVPCGTLIKMERLRQWDQMEEALYCNRMLRRRFVSVALYSRRMPMHLVKLVIGKYGCLPIIRWFWDQMTVKGMRPSKWLVGRMELVFQTMCMTLALSPMTFIPFSIDTVRPCKLTRETIRVFDMFADCGVVIGWNKSTYE